MKNETPEEREKRLQYHRDYYKNNKNKLQESNKLRNKKHYLENKEAYKKKNKLYRSQNNEKFNLWSKQWSRNNPEKNTIRNIKSACWRRKISYKDYQNLFAKQNGVCAICNQAETMKNKSGHTRILGIDHDHKSNKVRGLLCYKCNLSIGFLKDNIESLQRAIIYLQGQ